MKDARRAPGQTFIQRTTIWIPAGVIALLMLPLAVTTRTFGNDWTLHLWLVRQQELNIQANGRPGLFLSAKPLGAFYPIFAFVGSGLYTVGGYLAIALGDRPIVAYKLLYLGALCLAYGGMTWLACQIGLTRWRSQIPGLVFVTGTYFVTDMFGRGDLAELVALAAIPFLIAAVNAVMTSSRLKVGYLLAVVLGVFVLSGSHNITLLYGTIFLALLALALLAAHAHAGRPSPSWPRLRAAVAAAAIGGSLNAWYLLPDLKYGSDTAVAKINQHAPPTTLLSGWRVLLDPLRPSHAPYPDIRVSLPWLFALWAIVVAVVAWRRIDVAGRRLIVLLTALAVLYVYLIVSRTPWRAFPHFLYNIQYTLRLHPYVLLATALLVMLVLVWEARSDDATRRATSGALAVIAVFTVGIATWQAWAVPSNYYARQHEQTAPRNFAGIVVAARSVRPPSWYEGGRFRDISQPVVTLHTAHALTVPEADVRGSTFSGRLDVPAGPRPFRTNIAAGPRLVRITGIKPIGITKTGFVVAVRAPGTPKTGPVDVTIRQAPSTLLRAGAFFSLLGLVALAALLAWPVLAWLRLRLRAAATAAA